MRTPRTLVAALAAGSLLLGGCGATTSEDDTDTAAEGGGSSEPLQVGAVLPLSGAGAYFGVAGRKGIELAVEQINADGGINGSPISVNFSDSQCSPLGSKQAAEKVIADGANAILGDECSSATLGMMPVLEEEEIPGVTPGSSALAITDPGNPWMFRIMPNEVMQGADLAAKATEELDAKTAVILHENTDAGIGNAEVFKEFFEEEGGKVLDVIGFDREVQDFTSIATRVAALGDVDVIPTYTLEGQGVNITNSLAQARVTQGGGGQAIQISTIWLPIGFEAKVAPDAAEGFVRIVQFDPNDPNAAATKFLEDFQAKFNEVPNHISAHAYDALMVIAEAARSQESTAPADIQAGLVEMEGFEGVTGTVSFAENDEPTCSCPNEQQNIEMDTIHYVRTLPGGTLESLEW
jgi:branched-chain amino acid transport system substrate-binding protein